MLIENVTAQAPSLVYSSRVCMLHTAFSNSLLAVVVVVVHVCIVMLTTAMIEGKGKGAEYRRQAEPVYCAA